MSRRNVNHGNRSQDITNNLNGLLAFILTLPPLNSFTITFIPYYRLTLSHIPELIDRINPTGTGSIRSGFRDL